MAAIPKKGKGRLFPGQTSSWDYLYSGKDFKWTSHASLVFWKNLVQRVGSEENNFVNTRFRCILTDLEESQLIQQNDCHL